MLGALFPFQCTKPIRQTDVVVNRFLLTCNYHAKLSIRVPVFAWGNLLVPWMDT
jgi:hypothetical protein